MKSECGSNSCMKLFVSTGRVRSLRLQRADAEGTGRKSVPEGLLRHLESVCPINPEM